MALVRLHLTLIELAGGRKEFLLEARPPVRLTSLLEQWGVPQEQVGIIVKNRKTETIDCLIGPEDHVELFPMLSGG